MTSATCGFALLNVSGRLLTSCISDLKPPDLETDQGDALRKN